MAIRIGTALACVAMVVAGVLSLRRLPEDRAASPTPRPAAEAPDRTPGEQAALRPAGRTVGPSGGSLQPVTLEEALRADGVSEDELFLFGKAPSGSASRRKRDAAERQADWDARFRAYLVQRDVLAAAIDDPDEREKEIESLRIDWFPPEEQELARQLEDLTQDLVETAGEEEELEEPFEEP